MSRRFCAGKSGSAIEPVKVATLRDGNVVITMTQKKPFYTALHILVSGKWRSWGVMYTFLNIFFNMNLLS